MVRVKGLESSQKLNTTRKPFKLLLFNHLFRFFPTLNETLKYKVVTKTVTTFVVKNRVNFCLNPSQNLGFTAIILSNSDLNDYMPTKKTVVR